ncbi:hypothetical protein Poli38472_012468 [Pythium oligandrum]|uniref:DDHD domain-containing protein n=1 Tax=Pythium oligandrum TaxID=41045 RepID=A0A8K1FPX5_PYTOL|nr:hypothetical protein Poli38472_012468 [Pythium oligandrum]|eukprot:TMW67352.1 hypothetical protein Poli38472_012468 [Pythium oligandrum]
MYHIAEVVRDAKRDMEERYEGGRLSTWAFFTPFPFLYALSGQITQTMQRKAPDLVKRAAVRTRDQIAGAVTTSQQTLHEWRVVTTRRGQFLFYTVKTTVETVELPGAIAPIRSHVAVPLLNGVEGMVQFVTSEELPELYFVAKNSMTSHVVLRHLVIPPLSAMEGLVRYMVILPSQLVFPSREEIEDRTDVFLHVSTSRLQSLVEYLYSATETLDQHWSMVQWNILGRGPYESLSMDRRRDVIHSVHQRMRIISSRYKLYEFVATIKMQNEMLFCDLLKEFPDCGGVPLLQHEVNANEELRSALDELDEDSFPCWFYRKIEIFMPSTGSENGDTASTVDGTEPTVSSGKTKWIEFPAHENRRLERRYRFYQRQKMLGRCPLPSPIVVVDEGRHEVNMETMEMTPVYWEPVEKIQVRRSIWLYAQRNYGLAPYNPSAELVLEQAFTYYLAFFNEEINKKRSLLSRTRHRRWMQIDNGSTTSTTPTSAALRYNSGGVCSLSVPVEGHLVELKGPHDITQYKRLLAGTTPFTSKRRVYRGDPRIRADPKLLEQWKKSMVVEGDPSEVPPNEDDADIEEEIDHLVLIVHGIGDALKTIDIINVVTLRSIIDCATSLRDLHREALRSTHFDGLGDKHPRTEFLPIEWHTKLHIEGLDSAIRDVTLPAIPKLREFANDTVLDVLFFMSPMFHRVILDHVANEMNRVYRLFQARHKGWADDHQPIWKKKKVSIVAHSLGSIICFDVLNHQGPKQQRPAECPSSGDRDTESSDESHGEHFINGGMHDDASGFEALMAASLRERSRSDSECISKFASTPRRRDRMRHHQMNGLPTIEPAPTVVVHTKKSLQHRRAVAGTRRRKRRSHTTKNYKSPRHPRSSASTPKGSSSTPRNATDHGVPELAFEVDNLFCFGSPVGLFLNVRGQTIDLDFHLPTCKRVFNIYHPYDPVAYRIEPILNPQRANSKAAIIRTFEGRLRFQYQLRNSFRRMWQKLRQWRRNFETQVESAVHSVGLVESMTWSSSTPSSTDVHALGDAAAAAGNGNGSDEDPVEDETVFGRLCQGLPIDYSLQENEIEITNEYLFALTSHVIYWNNRDASLFLAQKMILEPPHESKEVGDVESDVANHEVAEQEEVDEDDDDDIASGTITPAFSPFGLEDSDEKEVEEKSSGGLSAFFGLGGKVRAT